MTPTTRYLKQATRGLWGQKKRDAVMELRGAIEDKVYRHQLCGLSEAEAELAALRDLGHPATIARDFHRVHTGPSVLRSTLLLGITGLLSLQVMAQVATVQAILDPNLKPACTLNDLYLRIVPGASPAALHRLLSRTNGARQLVDQVLGALSAAEATYLRAHLEQPGGMERVTEECLRATPIYTPNLLRLDDVYAALRSGGVEVTPIPGAPMVQLSFPGARPDQGLNLEHSTQVIDGATYISGAGLISQLKESVTVPLTLTGRRNPTLMIGSVKLQLGSPEAPVHTADLYARLMVNWLVPRWPGQPNPDLVPLRAVPASLQVPLPLARVRVPEADGSLYGVVSNTEFFQSDGPVRARFYTLAVREVDGGRLSVTEGRSAPAVTIVSTLPELLQATAHGSPAALVYRIQGSELHHLTYTPVPADQFH
ncbi:permease prefix domain 1-containing protein [Deinococcus sonorensis]|uniref:Permease prefix domain 1-containing protein n=1 Tax=Deinococcus sonorensis TaxID=309891 RepID=A0ABV8YAX2_9DEIO